MAQKNVKGVAVDSDARRIGEPVTRVVWPSGLEQDADDWSSANNWTSAGARIADGFPDGPEMVLNPDATPAPGNEPPAEQRSAPSPSPTNRPTPTSALSSATTAPSS